MRGLRLTGTQGMSPGHQGIGLEGQPPSLAQGIGVEGAPTFHQEVEGAPTFHQGIAVEGHSPSLALICPGHQGVGDEGMSGGEEGI